MMQDEPFSGRIMSVSSAVRVSYTHLRAHETRGNLVFTGDNSRIYEGEDRTGTLIQFDFGPWHFQNETYWNEVNYYWRKD